MVWWWIVPGLAVLLAVSLLGGGFGALARRRPYGALGGVFGGAAVLAMAMCVVLLGLDIQTYSRLSFERPVATIDLRQTGQDQFDATIAPISGGAATYALRGDEWRLEARVLKWKPWANVLGLDARYRLDRLAGEFADPAAETNAPRSVADLGATGDEGDLLRVARRFHRTPLIDTLYGSATLMPMADGAKYEIWMSQSGLLARPINPAATNAVAVWK